MFDANHSTKLSSAGLIYKHFGKDAIRAVASEGGKPSLSDAHVDLVFHKIYDSFIEEMDAIDNGIDQYPDPSLAKYEKKKCRDEKKIFNFLLKQNNRYQRNTSLPSRVGLLNPSWNDTTADVDSQFAKAVALTQVQFCCYYYY